MGAFAFENEHPCAMLAATLSKAVVFDAPIVSPKVEEAIKSVEILDGNGDVGTIKKMTFVEGGKTHYLKHKVDALDKDNFMHNYAIVESDAFLDYYVKISYKTKLLATPNGSIMKAAFKVFTNGDAQIKE